MIKKLLIAILLILIGLAGYFFISINSKVDYKAQAFYIEKGDGAKEIAKKLEDKGIIKGKTSFKIYALVSGKGKKFFPGDHVLSAGLNSIEIVDKLIDQNNINKERNITILEGWSLKDIANYLDEQNIATKDNFMDSADIDLWRDKYDFLNDKKITSLEGFLFPDTYRIFIDASATQIIAKMLNNFESKFTDLESGLGNRSIAEVIIMASIIEQEGKYKQDKKMIADIFWKRIEIGMALQSDATINYLTEKGETRSSGKDLEIDSPYNTYKYRGLPPGPISNPGIDSINSAIYPQANDYFYFITDATGKAIYAKTYDEHRVNIRKFLD